MALTEYSVDCASQKNLEVVDHPKAGRRNFGVPVIQGDSVQMITLSRLKKGLESSLSPEQRDLAGLESLLAHDVQMTGDGGGKAPALARTLHGRAASPGL